MLSFFEFVASSRINFFATVGIIMVIGFVVWITISMIEGVVKAWPRKVETHNHFYTGERKDTKNESV